MEGKNFNRSNAKPRVLVAPLDWGLGHATRCVPLINELMANGCEVIIAAEGAVETLLRQEFPDTKFLSLEGYRIKYSRSKFLFSLKILVQLPRIFRMIKHEQAWLKKCIGVHGIDAVISDNRPGLYSKEIPSVYITHQLSIKTGSSKSERIVNKWHFRYINRFAECWVPDAASEFNLAGELSHPAELPKIPVKYLGPLSRFSAIQCEKKYELLILLSGPEPQRTVFENILKYQLEDYEGSVIMVRGLPGNATRLKIRGKEIEQYNHLPAAKLNELIQQSKLVLGRSGYTTVMDLAKLQQKAILVATPGQAEQEYLCEYLLKKNLFFCEYENDFVLFDVLEEAKTFQFEPIATNEEYKPILKDWLTS